MSEQATHQPKVRASKPLTARQQRVLDAIETSFRERGYAPTLRELCASLGISSTNGVSDHLRAIERKGFIRRDSMRSRAIVLAERPRADQGVTVSCPHDDGSGTHVRAMIHLPELSPAECATRWAAIDVAFGRCVCGATTTLSGRVRS